MKIIGWILIFVLGTAFAQEEVIESTPLSVEDDGSRKIIEGNPEDGKLQLGSAPETSTKVSEVIDAPEKTSEVVMIDLHEEVLSRYLQFSFGYLNSRYEKIDSSLDNGSVINSIRFVGDLNQHFQSGFAVEILMDTSGQTIPDNIRSLQYRLFTDYHRSLLDRDYAKIDWLLGMAFSAGDFGIRKRYLNSLGEEASQKLKDGTIFGLIPSVGLRFYLLGRSSLDLVVEYHQYFGKPQSYMGGLAFTPRLSFQF